MMNQKARQCKQQTADNLDRGIKERRLVDVLEVFDGVEIAESALNGYAISEQSKDEQKHYRREHGEADSAVELSD